MSSSLISPVYGKIFLARKVALLIGFVLVLTFLTAIPWRLKTRKHINSELSEYQNEFNRFSPFIFLQGPSPFNKVQFLCNTLDAHPHIRCKKETVITPLIMNVFDEWTHNKRSMILLEGSGISRQRLIEAISAFFLEAMVLQGETAEVLCNTDTYYAEDLQVILQMFHNSKFIIVLNDARQIPTDYRTEEEIRKYLLDWNKEASELYQACLKLGSQICRILRHEDIISQTLPVITKLTQFLEIPMDNSIIFRALREVLENQEQDDKHPRVLEETIQRDIYSLVPSLSLFGYDLYSSHYNFKNEYLSNQSFWILP